MPGVVDIWNSALQKVGAKRVSNTDENSASALACKACYEAQRDAELRAHTWNFAKRRASLPAVSPAPAWGRANAFNLPSDWLRMHREYSERNTLDIDYEIEGRQILSNYDAPLNIRYIAQITDVNTMDPLFREVVATRMAIQMAEQLTQSNTKKQSLENQLLFVRNQAVKANAMDNASFTPPEDPLITCRR